MITKATNKMQLCRLIYYSLSALHVLGDVFAHHQEHLTVFTACGCVHHCVIDGLERSSNPSMTSAASDIVEYYQMLQIQSSAPDDGRKHRAKHVELTRNNKLTYIVASCWLFS